MKLDKIICDKVAATTQSYIKTYPTEFQAYRKQMKLYRSNLKTPYAEISGYQGAVIRELIRWPETLYALIKKMLTTEEQAVFAGDKYQIWFGNKFSDFRVTEGKL